MITKLKLRYIIYWIKKKKGGILNFNQKVPFRWSQTKKDR